MDILRPKPAQLIPEDAERVFKGETLEIYSWSQKLFDGSTAIYESTKRPDSVTVIPVTQAGKIILLRQMQSGYADWFWSFPGGEIDEGETALEAGRRELLEETGYESKDFELWDSLQPFSRMDWAVYTFVARDCVKKQEQSLDGGEKIEVSEIDFEEFLDVVEDDNFRHTDISIQILKAKLHGDKTLAIRRVFGL